jgi:galactose-1-phosphate uridylyltransferase
MTNRKDWALKGTFYECCRVLDGHCGLWFNRGLPEACANLLTYQIKEGQIQNVDMKGIIITCHMDGIGPTPSDLAKGVKEGAAYISENATGQQRKILEPFVMEHLEGRMWRKRLGIKYVKINISEKNGTYRIMMPFGELEMSLTVGGDGKNPVRIEKPCLFSVTSGSATPASGNTMTTARI